MSSFKPKGGDKQDVGGVYGQHGNNKQNPPVEFDINFPGGGTPFNNCCSDVSLPSGSSLAQSTITPTATGFDHFDGVATIVSINFPNTIVGSTDYVTPTITDNGNGTVSVKFVDNTTRNINVSSLVASHANASLTYSSVTNTLTFVDNAGVLNNYILNGCTHVINAGTTANLIDNTRGADTVNCGDTVHFWSTTGSMRFDVSAGPVITGDVVLAPAQAEGDNLLQIVAGTGLYAPTPLADGVTITGTGVAGDPFVATVSAFECSDLNTCSIDALSDVDTTTVAPTSGQFLMWDGSQWEPSSLAAFDCSDLNTCSVDALSDVDTTSVAPTSGQALVWDGAQWEPGDVLFQCSDLNSCSVDTLSDVDTTSTPPTSGQQLTWDGANWIPASASVFSCSSLNTCSVDSLSDVDITSVAPTSGQILGWDGSEFAPIDRFNCTDLNGCSVDALSDVDTTSAAPSGGQALVWSGTEWVPGYVQNDVVFTDNSVSTYDADLDLGSSNRPTSPLEGDEVIEFFANGLLREIYDGTQWISTFSASCCPGPTQNLNNASLTPANAELPTNLEIQNFYNALSTGDQGPGTQITYVSPRGSYFTWIVDTTGTVVSHERRFVGGAAPDVSVNATAAGSQGVFDGLLPTVYPEGYDSVHIYIEMGASDYTLDNFAATYLEPDGVPNPHVYIHNVGTTGGNMLYTMPITGNIIPFGEDDVLTLTLNNAGNWTLTG